jgi:hypothetical protein
MKRQIETLVLLVILAGAVLLRLRGIDWGLPYPYHPDEGSILFHALGFGTGDLNPHWFRWPSLMMYGMFGVYGVYYVAGRLLGIFGAPLDLVRSYLTDLSPFWLMGRYVSAAAGVATVGVAHSLGSRAQGRSVGIISALFLAVAYLHVRDSHYATPDVAAALMASVSLLFSVRACSTGKAKDLILSGLLAGLAASAKYTGGLAAAGTVAAFVELARARKTSVPTLAAAGAACVLGFVAGTPYSVLSWGEFSSDVTRQFTMVSRAGVAQEASSFWAGLREIFTESLGRGVGYPLVALAAIGSLLPGRTPRPTRTVLTTYVLAFLVVMSLLTVKRSTYLTPALPAVAVLAALGLETVLTRATGKREGAARWLTGIAAVAFASVAVMPSVRFGEALEEVDTRTRSKHWIETTLPEGARVATEEYGPVLNPRSSQLAALAAVADTRVESWEASKRKLAELKFEIGSERSPQFEVYGIDRWEEPYRLPGAADDPAGLVQGLLENGVRYVVLSSKAAPWRFMHGAEPPTRPGPETFPAWLSKHAVLLRSFKEEVPVPAIDRGAGRSFHNPVIEIYEIVSGGAATAVESASDERAARGSTVDSSGAVGVEGRP